MLEEVERPTTEDARSRAGEGSPSREKGPKTEAAQTPRSPYWLIVRGTGRGPYGMEVFTVGVGDDKALPVFGCQEDAEAYIEPITDGGHWWPRKTGNGELLSMLSSSGVGAGPCAGVEKVSLGPSAGMGPDPACVGRKCFMERLMGRDRAWFDGKRKG